MRGQRYQIFLILLMALSAGLYAIFVYREVFPQYRIYQDRYQQMEQFRSTLTKERPAPFSTGIKQVVFTPEDGGPETIDRCTTCHVALDLEHFSPTRIARDVNGAILRNVQGVPLQEQNPNYVWNWLDARIERLKEDGKLRQAEQLEELKVADVEGLRVDMTKVLAMHPLIGKETRPFEYHPVEEYGCTVCHGGNGRALTYKRAHGPVFDGQYEEAHEGPRPQFLERDPKNDPQFSRIFNHKPGHKLLFQTTPILVGGLMDANCVQCHISSGTQLQSALDTVTQLEAVGEEQAQDILLAYEEEKQAVLSLFTLQKQLRERGYEKTVQELSKQVEDFTLSEKKRRQAEGALDYLRQAVYGEKGRKEQAIQKIRADLVAAIGSENLAEQLREELSAKEPFSESLSRFVSEHMDIAPKEADLFAKAHAASKQKQLLTQLARHESSFDSALFQRQFQEAVETQSDRMTQTYRRGEELFVSQACYPCHKIAGFSRGGVGPELTYEGQMYPWFIKESIVWPQADLRTSTMPNFRLDHEELQALVTFLLAQRGRPKALSEVQYQMAVRNWEQGKKLELEKEIEPNKITDLRFGMSVFATQGCASCHRLKGFESDVGYAIEQNKTPSFADLYAERQWFARLFPEGLLGSEIVQTAEKHADEIDRRIVEGVRKASILEYLQKNYPGAVSSFYSNFSYAERAKDHHFETLFAEATTEKAKAQAEEQLAAWLGRIHRLLMMYIQEYGLGRQIGPRLNWSGIYRSDQWLMEHFYNPTNHVARSIMPVFPFDETKFYALTYMLDVLAERNLNETRKIWDVRGFNPELAFNLLCAQCHGTFRQGGGPVAEWIYPIPKSLRNADFMRNLTRGRAAQSIIHGVKGGPMPPWGETPQDKPFVNHTPVLTENEVRELVDWLFLNLPGGQLYPEDVEPIKWQYGPEDVIDDLRKEGDSVEDLFSISSGHASPKRARYLAAATLNLEFPKQQGNAIFAMRQNPIEGAAQPAYYIKKKYYTEKNLTNGERFFVENCSVCHGKEGGGTGLRAGSMVEAKPRMLTNLDWLATRDDLRLIRSIKFGVPGTSMVAWGDATTSLQRLQLVMYIRSLSAENRLREEFAGILFVLFDKAIETVRAIRIPEYEHLLQVQEELERAQQQRQDATTQVIVQSGRGAVDTAVAVYQKELALQERVNRQKNLDKTLEALIELLREERRLYDALSASLIVRLKQDVQFDECIEKVQIRKSGYRMQGGLLQINEPNGKAGVLEEGLVCVQNSIMRRKEKLEDELHILAGRLPSKERSEKMAKLSQKIRSYTQAAAEITQVNHDAARLRASQAALVQEANTQIEALKKSKSKNLSQ